MAKNLNINLGDNTDSILIVNIHDKDGNDTGETLQFDLEDIELPLKYHQIIEEDKRNRNWLKNQFVIIDRKKDVKGKKMLSKNEEEKMLKMKEFYEREMNTIDSFLGKGGCKKMLNGRKPYWEMFSDIIEDLKPVIKELDLTMSFIENKIKNKYGQSSKEENVLE